MAWTWEDMLFNFRALGGTADNIVRSEGQYGRGIFPVDRTRPVHLRVPENLLIPESDVEFVDDRLRIRESARFGQAEREFFEEYQNTFSWGGGGRSDCAAFIQALDELAAEVRSLLSTVFGMSRLFGEGEDRLQKQFLQSRRIERNGEFVLMPVMELVNHGFTHSACNLTDGISIEGLFSDEVFVRYDVLDPFGIFQVFGFASPERLAFSLPAKGGKQHPFSIKRSINLKFKCGSFDVPDFNIDGDTLTFSCLMIGNMNLPGLSKGIFCHVMREAGRTNPEDEFDMILHQNWMRFLKLIEVLEPYEGELIATLRKMARYQLEAMSHCFGTQDL